MVARLHVGHARSDRLDDARALVPQHDGRIGAPTIPDEAVERVLVAVADAGRDGAHQQLLADRIGDRYLLDSQRLMRSAEYRGTHPGLLASGHDEHIGAHAIMTHAIPSEPAARKGHTVDWSDSEEQAAFRAEVRELAREGLPAHYRQLAEEGRNEASWQSDRVSTDAERRQASEQWVDALAEKGWIAPHWPKEYGGAGLGPMEQFIFKQELAYAGAPEVGGHGVMTLGPTLIVHGSEEQRERYLPPILAGETAWAQGYSEPAAGSDLASLQTAAVRDGDEYVINGQKIWTSGAHVADSLFLLTRTDREAPKHRGISFMIVDDIHSSGLEVRPLVDMGWRHEFNETFFEDVRTPADHVVGEVDRGWYVGMTLMDFERSGVAGAMQLRAELDRFGAELRAEPRWRSRLERYPTLRSAVADRLVETEVGFNFSGRIASMQDQGVVPNYEASIAKVFVSETAQRIARTETRAFGLYANLWDPDEPRAALHAGPTQDYVRKIANTIYSGTSEIQRNIIATRGLGLPRS